MTGTDGLAVVVGLAGAAGGAGKADTNGEVAVGPGVAVGGGDAFVPRRHASLRIGVADPATTVLVALARGAGRVVPGSDIEDASVVPSRLHPVPPVPAAPSKSVLQLASSIPMIAAISSRRIEYPFGRQVARSALCCRRQSQPWRRRERDSGERQRRGIGSLGHLDFDVLMRSRCQLGQPSAVATRTQAPARLAPNGATNRTGEPRR